MRSGRSLATCFFKRRNMSGRSLAASRRRASALRRFHLLFVAFTTRLIGFMEMLLRAEVAGLDEIHDAPQIEQAVFQRSAGQRQPLIGLQLLHRLRDLRGRILDELRFIQYHGAEGELLQRLKITAKQRVIRHDDVVLRNLFAQVVPRRTAFEHEHFQVRRELFRLAPPVVQHGRRTDDQRGTRAAFC